MHACMWQAPPTTHAGSGRQRDRGRLQALVPAAVQRHERGQLPGSRRLRARQAASPSSAGGRLLRRRGTHWPSRPRLLWRSPLLHGWAMRVCRDGCSLLLRPRCSLGRLGLRRSRRRKRLLCLACHGRGCCRAHRARRLPGCGLRLRVHNHRLRLRMQSALHAFTIAQSRVRKYRAHTARLRRKP